MKQQSMLCLSVLLLAAFTGSATAAGSCAPVQDGKNCDQWIAANPRYTCSAIESILGRGQCAGCLCGRTPPAPARRTPAPSPQPPATPAPASGADAPSCPRERVRHEWKEMGEDAKNLYIDAIKAAWKAPAPEGFADKDHNLYFHIVRTHAEKAEHSRGRNVNDLFLPWHRGFTLYMEDHLRALAPKFACITIPYWDWAQDAGDHQPIVVEQIGGFGVGRSGVVEDMAALGGDGLWTSDTKYDGVLKRSDSFSFQYGSASMRNMIENTDTYSSFRERLESTAHNSLHGAIGGNNGQMSQFISPYDPMFFLHHAMVDKLWSMHQDCHADALPTTRTLPKNYGSCRGHGPYAKPASGVCNWDAPLNGLGGMTARDVWASPVKYSLNEADLILNDLASCDMSKSAAVATDFQQPSAAPTRRMLGAAAGRLRGGAAKKSLKALSVTGLAKWAAKERAQKTTPRPKALMELAAMEAHGVDRLVKKNKAGNHWDNVLAKVDELRAKRARARANWDKVRTSVFSGLTSLFAVGNDAQKAEAAKGPETMVSLAELAKWECESFPPAVITEGMFAMPAWVKTPCQLLD